MSELPNNNEQQSSEEHSRHSSSHKHHHHHKPKIRIPKNVIVIALAAVAFIGLFYMMIRNFDAQDAEQPQPLPQVTADNNAEIPAPENTAAKDAEETVPDVSSAQKTGVR